MKNLYSLENFGAFGGWKNNIGSLTTTKGYIRSANILIMKKLPILSVCLFMTYLLNAHVPKTTNITTGGIKAGTMIKEPVREINGNTALEGPDSNVGMISKLAKHKALRNLLQEQMNRRNNQGLPNKGGTIAPINNTKEPNNLMQQLDQKIREEEQRAEMMSRHRMEMEMRM